MFFDDSNIDIKYIEATNFYKSGCIKAAKVLFQELILSDPFKWEFWFSIGAIYQLEKNYNEAILSYKRAIVLNRFDSRIYFHLSECYLSVDDKKNAIFCLNLANEHCLEENLKDKILILLKQNSYK